MKDPFPHARLAGLRSLTACAVRWLSMVFNDVGAVSNCLLVSACSSTGVLLGPRRGWQHCASDLPAPNRCVDLSSRTGGAIDGSLHEESDGGGCADEDSRSATSSGTTAEAGCRGSRCAVHLDTAHEFIFSWIRIISHVMGSVCCECEREQDCWVGRIDGSRAVVV